MIQNVIPRLKVIAKEVIVNWTEHQWLPSLTSSLKHKEGGLLASFVNDQEITKRYFAIIFQSKNINQQPDGSHKLDKRITKLQ